MNLAEDEEFNSVADSSNSADSYNTDSFVSDSSGVDEVSSTSNNSDYTAVIIKNQETIINNQNSTIAMLGTIIFLIVLSVGIYLTFKLGKFIQKFFI